VKTYEAVARAFAAEGVTTVFALMGDANIQWYVTMAELGVSMVATRHETGAVAMADGYAQSGGGVGVCSVTSGPGLLQSGNALANAARSGVSLVMVAGDTPSTAVDNPADIDQRRFVESCGATFVALRSPATALEDVRRAFYRARADRCAVVLNAPMDVQAAEYPKEWTYRPTTELLGPPQAVRADSGAVDRLCDLIASSHRPVVLAGRGAMLSTEASNLCRLAQRIGALTATTMPAKGWLDEDPFAVGVVGANVSAVAEELFAEADLVLAFGSTLDRFTVMGRGRTFPRATIVSINTQGAARAGTAPVDQYLTSDAGQAASAILQSLEKAGLQKEGFRTSRVRDQLAAAVAKPATSEPGRLDPREVMQILERHLSRAEHHVVIGSGHFFSWPIMYLRRPTGGRFIFTHYIGSIGLTLATGIGAAVANPDHTVVVIEGDGSMMTSLPELETAARLGIRLLVVVLNDEAFGAEWYKARTFGLAPELALIPTPSFDEVARALGGDGARAVDADSLESALKDFDVNGGVRVIDARIDGQIACGMYRQLHFNLPNEGPHQREPLES
jgi:thiamine pyrophosphate-dependent acetolactate synthase large subunit-like protein